MYVANMKFMSKDIFLSLSDDNKLRMTSNQLYVLMLHDDDDNTYQDIFSWLCENTIDPFYMTDEKSDKFTKIWIYFYEETDLVAFKLRWM